MSTVRFKDRSDGGRQLAEQLRSLDLHDPVVLALPRGGVPIGFEVAVALNAPLDVFVARKVGAPGQPEFGIGAIAEGDGFAENTDAVRMLSISQPELEQLVAKERPELERRVRHYRGDRQLPPLAGADVVLVDDGLATGVTAEAALRSLRAQHPNRLVLAAPVCAPQSKERLARVADDVVCVETPARFTAVGQWYDDFDQTDDGEVLDLLGRAFAMTRR